MSGYKSARLSWRNGHIYDSATHNYLGGVHQAGSITYANFDNMLRSILVLITADHFLIKQNSTERIITPTNDPVVPGDYEIISRGKILLVWALYCHWQFFLSLFFFLSHLDPINVTDEQWLFQAYSFNVSGRDSAFRDGIRERDRKCMVSSRGGLLASAGVWVKLEAAHVFPLEYENPWNQFGYSRWITNMDETTGLSKINSVQNGLLMARDLHAAFDQWFFSVNPDVGTLSLFVFFFFFFLCVCVCSCPENTDTTI